MDTVLTFFASVFLTISSLIVPVTAVEPAPIEIVVTEAPTPTPEPTIFITPTPTITETPTPEPTKPADDCSVCEKMKADGRKDGETIDAYISRISSYCKNSCNK